MFDHISKMLVAMVTRWYQLCVSLVSYVVLAVSFVVFVCVNGSIVVGDKTHHMAMLHLPQLLYFAR